MLHLMSDGVLSPLAIALDALVASQLSKVLVGFVLWHFYA